MFSDQLQFRENTSMLPNDCLISNKFFNIGFPRSEITLQNNVPDTPKEAIYLAVSMSRNYFGKIKCLGFRIVVVITVVMYIDKLHSFDILQPLYKIFSLGFMPF